MEKLAEKKLHQLKKLEKLSLQQKNEKFLKRSRQ